jgi:hypothetical protein
MSIDAFLLLCVGACAQVADLAAAQAQVEMAETARRRGDVEGAAKAKALERDAAHALRAQLVQQQA